jgi:hypothetical protein
MSVLSEQQILETYVDDMILRQIQVDRLSRKYNRLIKLLLIIDCAALSSRAVTHSEFHKGDKQRNDDLRQYTHVEYVGRILVINTPWIARRFWGLAKHGVPKRTRQRVFLYGADYRAQIMDQISLRTLSTLATFRKSKEGGGEADAEGGEGGICTGLSKCEPTIPAGQAHEVMVEVDPATTRAVRWRFEVTTRDIKFSVSQFVMGGGEGGGGAGAGAAATETAAAAAAAAAGGGDGSMGASEQMIVEESTVSVADGVTEGVHEVGAEGLVTVRFSNKHSWMRGNSVKYEVEKIFREVVAEAGGGAAKEQ